MKFRTIDYQRLPLLLPVFLTALLLLASPNRAGAGVYFKANDTTDLDLAGSWSNNAVPGSGDTAFFDGTFSAANNSANLGTNLTWSGIRLTNNLQSSFTINATGTNALTLGTGGIDMSFANASLTLNCPVNEGGVETWNVGAGQALTFNGPVNAGSSAVNNVFNLTTTGSGVINFNGNYFDGGNSGQLTLINSNTVNINPGPSGSFVSFKKFAVGNINGSTTVLNILSGANNISPTNYVVSADNTSTSTINISGGWTTINNSSSSFCTGLKGTGFVNVTGGTLAIGSNSRVSLGSDAANGSGTAARGTLTISGSGSVVVSNSSQFFQVGSGLSSTVHGTGTLNLFPGGTLVMGRNFTKYSAASGTIVFSGGTLVAATNSAAFLQGLTTATVSTNGVIINDGGLAITIAQPLLHDTTLTTDGGLTKQGAGTLTLAGTNTYNGPTLAASGTLVLSSAAAAAPGSYTVNGGATLHTIAGAPTAITMAVNSMTLNTGAILTLDSPDLSVPLLSVTNQLAAAVAVTINLTNMVLTPGAHPLIKYGTLGGAGVSAFVLGSTPQVAGETETLVNDIANSSIDLVLAASAPVIQWNGNINGDWDVNLTANWQTNGVAGFDYTQPGGMGPEVQFDDTATGTTSVTLNTTASPAAVIISNSVATYTISGSGMIAGNGGLLKEGTGSAVLATINSITNLTTIASGTLQLGDGLTSNGSVGGAINDGSSLIVADSQAQTMNNFISGSGSLIKQAAGTLTLTSSNTLTGPVQVIGGSLTLNSGNADGSIPVLGATPSISVASGSSLVLAGANALGWSSNSILPVVSLASGATLNTTGTGAHSLGSLSLGDSGGGSAMTGPGSVYVTGNITNYGTSGVNLAGLTIGTNNIDLMGGVSSLTVSSNLSFIGPTNTLQTVIQGDPNNGPGTLTTEGPVNVYHYLELEYMTWNVNLGNNSMLLTGKFTVGKTPGLPAFVEWNSGNGLYADNDFFAIADSTGANSGAVGQLDVLGGTFTVSNNASRCLIGNAGTATVNVTGGSLQFLGSSSVELGGDTVYGQSGSSGLLNLNGGSLVFGPASLGLKLAVDAGSKTGVSGTLNLNGGILTTWPGIANGSTDGKNSAMLNFNGGILRAGTNSATFLQGLTQATIQTGGAVIDDGGWRVTIGQALGTDGSGGGLTKLGTGTLILTNVSTYTGETVVSNGVLEVDGNLSSSPVVVATGGTLSGFGQLGEDVTINAGGALIAGTNGVPGLMAITGNLDLTGSLSATLNKGLVLSNSLVEVTGGITNLGIGVVTVTNAGPALAVGDSFTLFSQPVQNGGALAIASTDGVTWTNRLAIDGSIQVLTVPPAINPLPGSIQVSASGNLLSLAWPTNSGWILQAQTNAPAVGLATNWTAVAGSANITNLTIPIDPANGTVFYRMVHP